MSRRIANTEPELIELIDTVTASADDLTWAIDLADGPAALLIALLLATLLVGSLRNSRRRGLDLAAQARTALAGE